MVTKKKKKLQRERWKDVPGYEGLYQVSDLGRVRSLDRVTHCNNRQVRHYKGKVLAPRTKSWGYLELSLYKKGRAKTYCVHKLVALVFIGRCPLGKECCHNNGNPADNRPENLRYDTHVANCADRKLHGRNTEGSKQPSAKLLEDIVVTMRNEYAEGNVSSRELAERYKVTANTVCSVLRRATWKHVGGADCTTMLRKSQYESFTRFTNSQVREMRRLREKAGWTLRALADKFGTSSSHVHGIITYKFWKGI